MLENAVSISSPDKVVFENEQITKGDIADYYRQIAERMLPYIRNRNLSLVQCPQGTKAPCFYKKNKSEGVILDPIKTPDDLLAHVQNNTLEFHTWGSCADNPDRPDMMTFDLDPDEGMELAKVRRGVKDLKDILDELKLKSFLKTSGNKGYHIVVPIKAAVSWDAVGKFAKDVALVMEKKFPNLYTENVRKANRKGKIFIDWIRNGRGATSVAPYSIRAKNARVSAPISWQELDTIAPNQITMQESLRRSKKTDPWKDFFDVQKTQWLKISL